MGFKHRLTRFAAANRRLLILIAVLIVLLFLGWRKGGLSPIFPDGLWLLIIGMIGAGWVVVYAGMAIVAIRVSIHIVVWLCRLLAAPRSTKPD